MKSIKPGRGRSGTSLVGSIVVTIFGIFWTIMAFSMTSSMSFGGAGIIGLIFPLFGVLFVVMGIVQAVYHFKNATGKDRFSEFDITEDGEEGDPGERWVQDEYERAGEAEDYSGGEKKFCPYCGKPLDGGDYTFCPYCGRQV